MVDEGIANLDLQTLQVIKKSMDKELIFIVENDRNTADILFNHNQLDNEFSLGIFPDSEAMLEQLHFNPCIIFLSYELKDLKQQETLDKIHAYKADLPIVFLSSSKNYPEAIKLAYSYAFDVIVKDQNLKYNFDKVIFNWRRFARLRDENSDFRERSLEAYKIKKCFPGVSQENIIVNRLIKKASTNLSPLLLSSEMGFDLPEVARYIHYNSPHSDLPIDCIDLRRLTAAQARTAILRFGRSDFELPKDVGTMNTYANTGTLVIQHFELMETSMQQRFYENFSSTKSKQSAKDTLPNARFILTTEEELEKWAERGKIHLELLTLLSRTHIHIPALSERPEDISELAQSIMTQLNSENPGKEKELSTAAMNKLSDYPFPLNITELKNVIRQGYQQSDLLIDSVNIQFSEGPPLPENFTWETSLDEYFRFFAKVYLKRYRDDVVLTAKKLKIGKSTLYRKLEQWMIRTKS